ncbi:melanocortin receptor 5-like [Rhopilema esculentum]|uniref:melanocortin receptor 5-like n=1 Tax=Rhopilema esculentum TaxID=499914 RepID=UPI0031D4144D|eukprot:gene16780-8240_t
MAVNNITVYSCKENQTGINLALVLVFLAIPFHVMILFTLAKDAQLCLPRHKILFCLSISHGLMIAVTSICTSIMNIFALTANSGTCMVLRKIVQFNGSTTMVVSSLTLIALSVERYVACIHGLRLHAIFTEQRVIGILSGNWFIGISCGIFISVTSGTSDSKKAVLSDATNLKILATAVALPTSLLLLVVQARLFLVSRAKIKASEQTESAFVQVDHRASRKRQMKVAVVAGMVVLSYAICSIPASCLVIVDQMRKEKNYPVLNKISVNLWMTNTLLDPFIYGIGMQDMRKALLRQLRKIRLVNSVQPLSETVSIGNPQSVHEESQPM